MKTWARVPEAAEHAKVSEWTIRQAIKSGELEAYGIGKGRSYRLALEDVDRWMASHSYEPDTVS